MAHIAPTLAPPTPRAPAALWPLCVLLILAYLALRLPNLRDTPVFCDEATYLRWAQLIAQDPRHYLLISMQDAKLPLHYWLLALIRPLSADPVYAGRLLSVFFGSLTIPVLFALCRELTILLKTPRSLAPFTAAFLIASPFSAIHQRLAIAEPLLLLQALTLAWLSFRLARHIRDNAPTRTLVRDALTLGLLWGLTLLTKQIFSYLFWLLPPTALLLISTRQTWRTHLRAFLPRYAVATLIGIACVVPVLLTPSPWDWRTRLIYKSDFTNTHQTRLETLWHNLQALFAPLAQGHLQWWPHDPTLPLDTGIFYLYFTPPILLLALVGIIALIAQRQWRLFAFCAIWSAALLGPLVAGATLLYARHLWLGAFPLFILAAWPAAQFLPRLRAKPQLAAIALCLLSAAFLWPLWATFQNTFNPAAPILIRTDRNQYITDTSAGASAEDLVAWLRAQADRQPITIVTGVRLGLRNDYTWLMLADHPNIQFLCDDSMPPLRTSKADPTRFLAGTQQWIMNREQSIALPLGRPIYYLAESKFQSESREDLAPLSYIEKQARLLRIFRNPALSPAEPRHGGIAVFQLKRPKPALEASAQPTP